MKIDIDAAFAVTGYYRKNKQFKIKIVEKWCYSDNIAQGFFFCKFVWSLLGNIVQDFYCPVLSQEYYSIIEVEF